MLGASSTVLSAPPDASRPRLLVVDDEAEMCNFVAEVAERAGYEVASASTPQELRRHLMQQFAVTVLDLDMPGVDGADTLRVMAARRSTLELILMSGHDNDVMGSAQRLAGAHGLPVSGVLSKPIRAATLSNLLGAGGYTGTPQTASVFLPDLRRALQQRQFVVHYQPQVSLATGEWVGLEALVRWQRPGHGLVMPDDFVPHIEGAGLAVPLTRQVTEMACAQCATGAALPAFTGRLSVNFPPAALGHAPFPDEVVALTSRLGWPRDRLCFEVTESSVAFEPLLAAQVLRQLRACGCRISIDDFGTGHSSLLLLKTLPLDEMKIDKGFIAAALQDRTSRVIVENSIKLAKELGLRVVAEGVETEEQWQWLRGLGCDVAQGYYVARPMPQDALRAWAATWSAPP